MIQGNRIYYYSVADHADLLRMEDACGNQMQNVLLAVDNDGMTGVVPSLITGNNVEVRRQKIDYLPLSFVTPLGADYNQIGHKDELSTCEYSRNDRA